MNPIIETKELVKVYSTEAGDSVILKGIDLRIDHGEFLAVMGPSGSGKSTLMHILGFLDTLTTGSYFFDGLDVSTLSDEELSEMRRKNIGFVFQAFFLLPKLTVLENVMLPLVYYGTPRHEREEKAMQAISAVGLEHRTHYNVTKLSGGEKQRVAIARALVTEPAVIFADEPTGNLDSASGAQVMEVLARQNEHGHTVILVTHETTTAEFAHRIVKIRDGDIIGDSVVENHRTSETYLK